MKPELPTIRRNRALRTPLLRLLAGLVLCFVTACGSETQPAPDEPDGEAPPTLVAQALPAFLAARGKTWPALSPRMVQIHRALIQHDLRGARKLLQQEITEHPDNDEAHYLIAEVQYNRARYSVANEAFEKVLRNGPTFQGSQQVFYYYGMCQMRLGNAALARESLLALLELKPAYGEALFALGLIDVQQGKPEVAIVFFEESIYSFKEKERQGHNVTEALARSCCGLGDAYFQANDLNKAKTYLENGLKLNPRIAKAHYALSRVLHRLGDLEGAARELAEFERLNVDQGANKPPGGTNSAKQ